MKKLSCITLALVLLLPVCLFAQSKNPVSDAARMILGRQAKNLTAAAEELPADKYGFKPTPAQISFGKLMEHIAESNDFLCSKIGSAPAPSQAAVKEGDTKDRLVSALKDSFDFCSSTLGKFDDSKLGDPVTLYRGMQGTKATALLFLSNDWADHYAAAAMYLRLSGLLPPTAKKE